MISHKLAAGDFDNLKGFVDANELERVKGIVERMTAAERSELAFDKADIKSTLMYDIVFTKDQVEGSDREFVEIFVVFLLRREKIVEEEWFVNMGFKNELKIGFKGDWIVNLLRFKKQ